jgi:hypothetical protein
MHLAKKWLVILSTFHKTIFLGQILGMNNISLLLIMPLSYLNFSIYLEMLFKGIKYTNTFGREIIALLVITHTTSNV